MLIKIELIHCKFQIKLFCKISYNSSSCSRLTLFGSNIEYENMS